jgi:tRNA(adenine34) deaminase
LPSPAWQPSVVSTWISLMPEALSSISTTIAVNRVRVRSKRLIATARDEMSNVTTTDIALMREAIALAAEADAPFGALIVKDGRVLARGRNSGKRLKDPTAHGEMVAIRHCLAEHGPEILRGATIYTSGEPCPMCMGAIAYCRIARVVYGASIEELSKVLGQIKVPSTEIAAKTTFTAIEVTGGVLAEDTAKLFDVWNSDGRTS